MAEKTPRLTSAELRSLRESMGLSTDWLAHRWHVSTYSLQRWEKNRALPDDLTADILRLKKTFDRRVDEICKADPESILVPRTAVEGGHMPGTWDRAIAERVRERTGIRILYVGDEQL